MSVSSSVKPAASRSQSQIAVPVEGMSCASCVRRVELAAGKVEGVGASSVNLATGMR